MQRTECLRNKVRKSVAARKMLGCGYLKHLHVSESAKYTSEIFLQEALPGLRYKKTFSRK